MDVEAEDIASPVRPKLQDFHGPSHRLAFKPVPALPNGDRYAETDCGLPVLLENVIKLAHDVRCREPFTASLAVLRKEKRASRLLSPLAVFLSSRAKVLSSSISLLSALVTSYNQNLNTTIL